jgi:hypothetical protein
MPIEEKSGQISISCPSCRQLQYVVFSAKRIGHYFQVLHCSPFSCTCGFPLAAAIEGIIQ